MEEGPLDDVFGFGGVADDACGGVDEAGAEARVEEAEGVAVAALEAGGECGERGRWGRG